MEYKKAGGVIVARLEVGEEIVACVARLAEREGITFAEVSGIGAVCEFAVSVYDVAAKRYYDNSFAEPMELTSLLGTVTRMDGKPYVHLHATAGGGDGRVHGGHLKRAVIGATCELVVRAETFAVGRRRDEATGLNVFCFGEECK